MRWRTNPLPGELTEKIMSFALCYWILMLIWLVFGIWSSWPNYKASGGNVLLFVLLVLLGWKVFGAPLHS